MSVPANLTFTDIQTRVLNELRIPVTNVTEALKVANLINMVYRDIGAKKDWWWLTKKFPYHVAGPYYPGVTELIAGVTFPTQSISMVHNSASIAFDIAPGLDLSNTALLVSGAGSVPSVNRIVNVDINSVNANLDSIYTGVTSTAVTSFFICNDIMDPIASDMNKPMRVTRYGYPYDLKRVGMEEMDHYKQFDLRRGPPELWTVMGNTNVTNYSTGSQSGSRSMPSNLSSSLNPGTNVSNPFTVPYPRQIMVHPYPDKSYRMDVWYKQSLNTELSGTDYPMIPDDYRQLLVYGSLARGYAIFLNDLDRSNFYQTLFNDMMALMSAQQNDYAKDQSGIQPRMHDYRRSNRRPRTAYTLGNWFDIFPSRP